MSSVYTQVISNLLFPLQERLKGHTTVKLRRDLEKSQWLSVEQIKQIQTRKLGEFLAKIYRHVPYYRQLIDNAGIDINAINGAEQLASLPFLTKALIRDNEHNLKADNVDDLKSFNTGGSSGSPLIFFLNNERVSHDVAAKWRATRWWGVDIGDKEIVAWGSPIELNGQDRIKLMRDYVMRSHLLPAFDLSQKQIRKFIQNIHDVRPKMLFGYPSVYNLLAQTAEAENIPLNNLGIAVAFVTSEKLYDHQRERIERVFGCPVANGYGGRDAGFIAHQCPAGSMHISAEDIIVEIVDAQGNAQPVGESGEIVITHLATSGFPFLRYRTGDVGALSDTPCSCGRGLPVLERIEGRSTDFVVSQDGTMMHGLALIYVLREIPEVQEFKIIQHSLDLTQVTVVAKAPPLSAEIRLKITTGLQQRLGKNVNIDIQEIHAIPPEKSGKHRYIQSNVKT